jgi:hypothetical protein
MKRRLLLATMLTAAVAATAKPMKARGSRSGAPTPPPAPSSDPHPLYAALDRNILPFHTASGAWGASVPLESPATPVTTREVTVTNQADLITEALVPGTRVIVGYSSAADFVIQGSITDLDLVIPPGRTLGVVTLGNYAAGAALTRVRVRGSTLGTYSGGSVVRLHFLADTHSDIIMDGIGFRGEGGCLESNFYIDGGAERLVQRSAITNCRFHSTQAVALWYSDHCLIAGCTTSTGRHISPTEGERESWCWRCRGAPFVYYDNDFRGTMFHRLRHGPRVNRSRGPEYFWAGYNTIKDLHEARILDATNLSSDNAGTDTMAGIWFVNNTVYAETGTGATAAEVAAQEVSNYASITNNTFYGDITQTTLNSYSSASQATTKDFATGNVYNAIQAVPAYGRAGDPEVLPLSYMDSAPVQQQDAEPIGSLSITVTLPGTTGIDGFVVYVGNRSRAVAEPSLYIFRYRAASGATSLTISGLASGTKYVRYATYTGSTVGSLSAEASYTPA